MLTPVFSSGSASTLVKALFFFFCNIRIFEDKCRGHSQTLKTELEERCDITQLQMYSLTGGKTYFIFLDQDHHETPKGMDVRFPTRGADS